MVGSASEKNIQSLQEVKYLMVRARMTLAPWLSISYLMNKQLSTRCKVLVLAHLVNPSHKTCGA